MKKLFLGLIVLAVFSGGAEAKQKRKHVARSHVAHPDCNILWPCIGVAPSKRGLRIAKAMPFGMPQNIYTPQKTRMVRSPAHGVQVSVPTRFVYGRLKCAINIGVALAERGIKGTGSAWAKSYLDWGRPSGPVPGAVAVFSRGRRGGHVAIVHDVRPDGTVIYLNPSSRRQAWQVGPYRKHPIAFRVAG